MNSNKNSDHSCESRLVLDWKRPAGPLNVWRIVEGEEKLSNGTARSVRFSIQEIPDNRRDEVIKHMCDYFIADEAMCKSLKLKDDPEAVNDFQLLWNYLLKKNLSIGAFKLNSNNEISKLVAANVLFVETQETENAMEKFMANFKSKNAKRIFGSVHEVSNKAEICKICGIDKYLTALGLSVDPAFRGQKLGVRLLEARADIGRKYGISVSSTIFSGPASQTQAERAGFKTVYSEEYADIVDAKGRPIFPNIQAKTLKIMYKELQ